MAHRRVLNVARCLLAALCLQLTLSAQSVDLTNATLEDLMNMQVTSVSRKEQSAFKAASSIYVITQDDIRHSGATNIPDLLRIVPGVDVARITANTWAISIRGFNYRYSGKVLVMIDGRSVYSPTFSGVFWDQQMVPLENIDRIEVIRGPGGTVWGANAMNGVINIITKSARDTQGGLMSAVAGNYDRAQGLVQYGGTAGNGAYRVYSRYTDSADSPSIPGRRAVDDSHSSQAGFRSDWKLSDSDNLTVEGDWLGESEGQTIATMFYSQFPNIYTIDDQVRVSAQNAVGQWTHTFANGSDLSTQAYFDRFRRFDQALNVVDTGDVELRYHFHIGRRHDIVSGFDYRASTLSYLDGYETAFRTPHRVEDLSSGFIQDEIALTDSLALSLGAKLEENSYTSFEYEPSLRIAWSPSSRHTLWASVSRAIEQPSWLYAQSQFDVASVPIPGPGFGIVQINGNQKLESPFVFDYEIGYRTQLSKKITLDATIFYSYYNHLFSIEPQSPYFDVAAAPGYLVIPSVFENLGNAKTYGAELSARWDVTTWWRISPGFSFLHAHIYEDAGSHDTTYAPFAMDDSPMNQAQVRSEIRLPHRIEWDTSVYYVGCFTNPSLPGTVPAYTRLDSRFGWHFGEHVDMSIAGQNLLSPRHLEFLDGLQVIPTEVARAIVARIAWRF